MNLARIVGLMLDPKSSKSLATVSTSGIVNNVPVSTVFVKGLVNEIILVDYFMQKTMRNIVDGERMKIPVSLTFWKGLEGYQFKCSAVYKNNGELFEETVEKLPGRKIKGIIILTDVMIFETSLPDN